MRGTLAALVTFTALAGCLASGPEPPEPSAGPTEIPLAWPPDAWAVLIRATATGPGWVSFGNALNASYSGTPNPQNDLLTLERSHLPEGEAIGYMTRYTDVEGGERRNSDAHAHVRGQAYMLAVDQGPIRGLEVAPGDFTWGGGLNLAWGMGYEHAMDKGEVIERAYLASDAGERRERIMIDGGIRHSENVSVEVVVGTAAAAALYLDMPDLTGSDCQRVEFRPVLPPVALVQHECARSTLSVETSGDTIWAHFAWAMGDEWGAETSVSTPDRGSANLDWAGGWPPEPPRCSGGDACFALAEGELPHVGLGPAGTYTFGVTQAWCIAGDREDHCRGVYVVMDTALFEPLG